MAAVCNSQPTALADTLMSYRPEPSYAPLQLPLAKAAQQLVTPLQTASVPPSDEQQDSALSGGDGQEEGLLPRLTRVLIRGNNRTKAGLVGQHAVVRKSVGLGGWHLLTLPNGEEVRLQRNALQIVTLPAPGETDFSDMDDDDTTAFPAGEPHQRPTKMRRPVRSSQAEATDAEDDYLERRASQRQATIGRINLQRLDAAALRRYRRFYKLPDVGPNSTKEQLLAAISRHFGQQAVDENRVIAMFVHSARQQALHGPSHEQQ